MKTKCLLTLFLLVFSLSNLFSQSKKLSNTNPFFVALIVTDIDNSIEWYKKHLKLEVANRIDLEKKGISMANLKSKSLQLELIEMKSALNSSDVLKDQPPKTKITGFFKFGFSVSDLDKWYKYFESEKVSINGSIVNDKISGMRMFLVNDPDGNRIQVFGK